MDWSGAATTCPRSCGIGRGGGLGVQACQERVTQEAATAMGPQQAKIETRQAAEAATGQKKRGRNPNAPAAAADHAAQAHVTDPDSRSMKTQAGYVHGSTAQAGVTEEPSIVAAEVTQAANAIKPLSPMLERAQANRTAIVHPQAIGAALADAGSGSAATQTEADPRGPELWIAPNKDWKYRQVLREQPGPRGRSPKGLTARDRMARTLRTQRGRRLSKARRQTVEPVFGQIKRVRGWDGSRRRGKAACDREGTLRWATRNRLTLWRNEKPAGTGRRTGRDPPRFGRGSGKKTGE